MQKILGIKNIKTKLGKLMVIITTAAQDYFVPLGMWRNVAQTDNNDVFVGGSIDVTFYQKGDKLVDGSECTADDVVIESISLQKNPSIVAMVEAESLARKTAEFNEIQAYNKRKREERLAKIAAAGANATPAAEPAANLDGTPF